MSQIEELRKIIVGDNSEQLLELKQRIEDLDSRTKDVAEVLAPAIKQRVRKDDELVQALEEPVSEGLKQAIRKEPAAYADILYPVMSPAIRRAISEAISSLLATINQTIESATTPQGLKTRFESIRTGIPYTELALRKLLLYRVEHVFLIERDTGLLIAELQNKDAEHLDSDAVSAMFSAIQSFVQDSFSQNEQDRLTDLTVGEHKVWVVHGPKAMLACVIRGDAPAGLRTQLHDVLDLIRIDFAEQIEQFSGDSSEFVEIEEYLKPCLQLQLKDMQGSQKSKVSLGSWVFLSLFIAGLAYGLYYWYSQHHRLNGIKQLLHKTPGLLVTDAQFKDQKLVVSGLKDPVAELPWPELENYDIQANHIEWQTKPFQSLEVSLVEKRIKQSLELPDTVDLILKNGVLTLSGKADVSWLESLKMNYIAPVGVKQIKFSSVIPTATSMIKNIKTQIGIPESVTLSYENGNLIATGEASNQWFGQLQSLVKENDWVNNVIYDTTAQRKTLIDNINSLVLKFDNDLILEHGSNTLMDDVILQLKKLIAMQNDEDKRFIVNLTASTDGFGGTENNKLLRQRRAKSVYDKLIENGIDATHLNIVELVESPHNERSVRFEVLWP